MLPHAPGVQVQAIPEDGAVIEDSEAEEKVNPDDRLPQRDLDKRIAHENEYSDSEDEGEGARRDNRSYKVWVLLCNVNNVYYMRLVQTNEYINIFTFFKIIIKGI